jgi:hypothetical protein
MGRAAARDAPPRADDPRAPRVSATELKRWYDRQHGGPDADPLGQGDAVLNSLAGEI